MKLRECPTYFAVSSTYFGALTVVFVIGFPSPTQKQLLEENILTYELLPIFASISHLTRVIGLIAAPVLVQFGYNLKVVTTVSCLFGMAGYLLIIFAETAALVIIGVALAGLYTGITTISLITYIAEITVDDQRRVLSGAYGFCIRIGLFIAYLAGVWLPFRWLAALGLIQISIFCFLFILNPLSPVWYIRQGLDEKARKILIYLHGSDFDSDTQIQKLKTESINDTPNWIESFKSLKEWKVLKPTILMVIVASLKSLGGHEAMVSFSSHILENQQAMDPKLASLFYPIFLIAGAIVCIFLLNSCKQKWLLIVSSLLLACSHISMAAYYYVSDNYLHCKLLPSQICLSLSFWPIFNIALFAFSYSLGWGLVYFSLLGVMFTVHREFSTAITEMINNLASYLVVIIFFYLLSNLGGFATFLIFSCNYIFAIVFVYFFIKV